MATSTINKSYDVYVGAIVLDEIAITTTYSNTSIDVSNAIPSEYTPLFGYCRATGSNAVYCYNQYLNASTKTFTLQLKSTGSSEIKIRPTLTIVSAKK